MGNRVQARYPWGTTLTYAYDELERLVRVAEGNDTLMEWTYDGARRVESKTRGNGVVSTYEYDDEGRVTGIQHVGNQTDLQLTYERDEMGRALSVDEERCGGVMGCVGSDSEYAYDGLGRLTQHNESTPAGNVSASWKLDLVNNWLNVTGEQWVTQGDAGVVVDGTEANQSRTHTEDSRVNFLQRIVENETGEPLTEKRWYGYDDAGNLVNKSVKLYDDGTLVESMGQAFGYDGLNRLTSNSCGMTGTKSAPSSGSRAIQSRA